METEKLFIGISDYLLTLLTSTQDLKKLPYSSLGSKQSLKNEMVVDLAHRSFKITQNTRGRRRSNA